MARVLRPFWVVEVEDVAVRFWSLGADTARVEAGLFCSRSGASADGPANFVHQLRPDSVSELEATLDTAKPLSRRIVLDPAAHPAADRSLHRDTTAAELRPLAGRDWPAIHEMLRIDHGEEDRRAGRGPRPARHTDEALALRRGIAEHADYLVATVDDVPVAFTCQPWPAPAAAAPPTSRSPPTPATPRRGSGHPHAHGDSLRVRSAVGSCGGVG